MVVARQDVTFVSLDFTTDGDLLATAEDGVLRRWPMSPASDEGVQETWSGPARIDLIGEIDPTGRSWVGSWRLAGKVHVVPLDGSQASTYELERPPSAALWCKPHPGPTGRVAAVQCNSVGNPELNCIRILDLETGDERTLDTHPKGSD
jgi:hypothetical protein